MRNCALVLNIVQSLIIVLDQVYEIEDGHGDDSDGQCETGVYLN